MNKQEAIQRIQTIKRVYSSKCNHMIFRLVKQGVSGANWIAMFQWAAKQEGVRLEFRPRTFPHPRCKNKAGYDVYVALPLNGVTGFLDKEDFPANAL